MRIMLSLFAQPSPPLLEHNLPSPKDYPWPKELASLLLDQEHDVIQCGAGKEPQFVDTYLKDLPFNDLRQHLFNVELLVAVDSYLQHLAWFMQKRSLVIFSISDPLIFGHADLHVNMLKDRKYLRANQFDLYYANQFNNDAFPTPEEVLTVIRKEFMT